MGLMKFCMMTSPRTRGGADKPRELRPGIALALSGGGFRATLFHLGALWRLNELGYLKQLSRITSVSGGSIINGVLATRWRKLDFDAQGVARNFAEEVAQPVRAFCNKKIDLCVGALGLLTWPTVLLAPLRLNLTPGHVLALAYDRFLFHGARLRDLPDDQEGPRFIFYATNYQTGVGVRFSRPYIGDWRLGLLRDDNIRIATAVAASSAFPPIFAPLRLRTQLRDWDPTAEAPLAGERGMRRCMYLADGGIYDNLGEEAARRYKTVLISDAGAPFDILRCGWLLQLSHVYRVSRVREVAMEQVRALRTQRLVSEYQQERRKGAYWGIATAINDYELDSHGLGEPMVHDNSVTASMQEVGTRLWPFPPDTHGRLINWGYGISDAALRRHMVGTPITQGHWPVSDYPLAEGESPPSASHGT